VRRTHTGQPLSKERGVDVFQSPDLCYGSVAPLLDSANNQA
jgi:hypothetical protein